MRYSIGFILFFISTLSHGGGMDSGGGQSVCRAMPIEELPSDQNAVVYKHNDQLLLLSNCYLRDLFEVGITDDFLEFKVDHHHRETDDLIDKTFARFPHDFKRFLKQRFAEIYTTAPELAFTLASMMNVTHWRLTPGFVIPVNDSGETVTDWEADPRRKVIPFAVRKNSTITISAEIFKLTPIKHQVALALHEMAYAYLYVYENNKVIEDASPIRRFVAHLYDYKFQQANQRYEILTGEELSESMSLAMYSDADFFLSYVSDYGSNGSGKIRTNIDDLRILRLFEPGIPTIAYMPYPATAAWDERYRLHRYIPLSDYLHNQNMKTQWWDTQGKLYNIVSENDVNYFNSYLPNENLVGKENFLFGPSFHQFLISDSENLFVRIKKYIGDNNPLQPQTLEPIVVYPMRLLRQHLKRGNFLGEGDQVVLQYAATVLPIIVGWLNFERPDFGWSEADTKYFCDFYKTNVRDDMKKMYKLGLEHAEVLEEALRIQVESKGRFFNLREYWSIVEMYSWKDKYHPNKETNDMGVLENFCSL